jgi:hypothetical protein
MNFCLLDVPVSKLTQFLMTHYVLILLHASYVYVQAAYNIPVCPYLRHFNSARIIYCGEYTNRLTPCLMDFERRKMCRDCTCRLEHLFKLFMDAAMALQAARSVNIHFLECMVLSYQCWNF